MDREKVIKALENFNKNRICLPHLIPWDEITDAIALLKEQEVVVRCKDCEFWYKDECSHLCKITGDLHPANWFCADGEHK